ncbi:MAG: hypothetical protein QOG64_118, partial [Acidimicrobiaceae bacterium]|nr:hypothetical protein [Acidimicrobiaceae bacterium]
MPVNPPKSDEVSVEYRDFRG